MKPEARRSVAGFLQQLFRYDFRASISLFFIALPLCLGISLASNAPLASGLLAGAIGGTLVALLSKSELSVSGPAAGLTAICAAAILNAPVIDAFFLSVALAGLFQVVLGAMRLGGFTHFIPSAVIKGMLSGIGVLLVSKQIPLLLGYDQPDFWHNEFFNILTFDHILDNLQSLYRHTSIGAVVVALAAMAVLVTWKRYVGQRVRILPASFVTVVVSAVLAWMINHHIPGLQIPDAQFVSIPIHLISTLRLIDVSLLFSDLSIWTTALTICLVASLETLLSIEAIDKLDPYNRVTPQNRELVAQGVGNMLSGMASGLPITAVIVRSAANAEAGAKTKWSALLHGVWLILAVVLGTALLNYIPYAVLAVLLVRTGLNLVKPSMIRAVYRQGRDQFLPFVVTVVAIVVTDLLIGVVVGCLFAVYFLIKHTYQAGYVKSESMVDGRLHVVFDLAINVSFLNKKRLIDILDQVPEHAVVTINGSKSLHIDPDVLEVLHDFKAKANRKHMALTMINVPDVQTIELHG